VPSIGSPGTGGILVNGEEDCRFSLACVCSSLEGVAASEARGGDHRVRVGLDGEVEISIGGRDSHLIEDLFGVNSGILIEPIVGVACSLVRD